MAQQIGARQEVSRGFVLFFRSPLSCSTCSGLHFLFHFHLRRARVMSGFSFGGLSRQLSVRKLAAEARKVDGRAG